MPYNHYFQAITNRTGDSLVGYFARVINTVSGNTVPLYADLNGTPIVTVSGVADMAKTDENGNVSFYNDAGTYHLDIYQPDATTFILRVPNVAMQSGQGPKGDPGPAGDAGASDSAFPTLAALKAIDPVLYPSPRLAAASGADGGAPNGLFTYQTAGAPYTADNVNVIKLDAVPLSTGALVRQTIAQVAYKAGGTDTRTRPAADVLAETPTTGNYNTLSAPLGFDNGPAFQKAINDYSGYAGNIGRTLYIPAGLWRTDTPIAPSDHARVIGEGPRSTIFYREQDRTTKPCFEQTGFQQGFQRIEGIGIRGYGIGEHVIGGVDGFRRKSINMIGCTIGFQFENELQTSLFEDIDFSDGNIGLWGKGTINNRVTMRDCDFKSLKDSGIILGGAEDFLVEGCRFEGGGTVPSGQTVSLIKVRNIQFVGGYFEGTQERAVRMLDSEGGVCGFSGTHFTGTGAGTGGVLAPFKWATDGSGRFSFHNCHSYTPMYVPYNSVMDGSNPGLIPRTFSGKSSVKGVTPTGRIGTLFTMKRENTSNSPTNFTALTGLLKLTYAFTNSAGSAFGVASFVYQVRTQAVGSGNISVTATKTSESTFAGLGDKVSIDAGTDAGSATVVVVLDSSVEFGDLSDVKLSWELQWDQLSSIDGNLFSVEGGN